MPSTFRASRSGRHLDGPNRTRNGQIDHDVFEGLPVRRWSKQPHTFSQAPKLEDSDFSVQGSGGGPTLPELPMPRDSQLLPPLSRALLRAARAGCVHIRQSGRAADEEEKSVADAEDPNSANAHAADRSFTTRKWLTLPKHLEPAEVEFLAKRRPGLPCLYGAAAGDAGAPMRRTKFKKTDPETGNISIYEAWVPEGHRIEGEITGDVQAIAAQSEVPVKPEAPAPGTVVEGVGIVNAEGVVVAEAGSAAVMTPPKRRPPPPKRKGKGIGKGRKKKVMFAPGEGADAATVHGMGDGTGDGQGGSQDGSRMSMDPNGQDDDEEDGDESDEGDEGDESMVDAKTPETPQPPSGTESVDQPSIETPAEQSVDVDMADAGPDNQQFSLEPSTSVGAETPSQQQVTDSSQPEKAPETDDSALDTSVPPKIEAAELDQKPAAPEHNDATLSSAEIAAVSNAAAETDASEPSKSEMAEATTDVAPKQEEPEATGQPEATAAPQSDGSDKLSEPVQPSLSTEVPAETEEPQPTSNETTTQPHIEPASAAADDDQKKEADIPQPNPSPAEAKDVEMSETPAAPEQSPVPEGTQSPAKPRTPLSEPPADESQPPSFEADSTAADVAPAEEQTLVAEDKTEDKAEQADQPEAETAAAEPEQRDDHPGEVTREVEQPSDSVLEGAPAESS
ncbi:hypothetical protein N7508_005574 [Penicillium antarcticum]|uniref:uncharacterized protein n=1 Tax=Penicillium antarcticum TaxID=416450 RepID=UPI0023844E0A|nr:uncharacterized protein N7508_005574 [Penicillium antarcticum]KAJ5306559.1 hypothetical protein N7508_005574 [Penicillium antarcticum]